MHTDSAHFAIEPEQNGIVTTDSTPIFYGASRLTISTKRNHERMNSDLCGGSRSPRCWLSSLEIQRMTMPARSQDLFYSTLERTKVETRTAKETNHCPDGPPSYKTNIFVDFSKANPNIMWHALQGSSKKLRRAYENNELRVTAIVRARCRRLRRRHKLAGSRSSCL